jgi:haloalkane dehalogenase
VEEGTGDPIVLLHGNPTSSYLWRNVIPELVGCGRVIAPDLIGQGDSDKLPESDGPDRYTFLGAYDYLCGLLDAIGVTENVTLVIHDWGSGLGFHWACNHPGAVRGIAYMEAIVAPVTWEDWPEGARGIFQGFRSEKGEDLVLNRNMFVEAVLPGSVLRGLGEEEMAHYRAPFTTPEDRRPTLNWPRQIPISGEPAHMVELVEEYGRFLAASDIPKLFINADPGSILVGRPREFCRSWPNQTEVTVKGSHFLQEDSPTEIGQAVANWLQSI